MMSPRSDEPSVWPVWGEDGWVQPVIPEAWGGGQQEGSGKGGRSMKQEVSLVRRRL